MSRSPESHTSTESWGRSPAPTMIVVRPASHAVRVAVVALVVGAALGYGAAHATTHTGPTTLSGALTDSAQGDLPMGDLSSGALSAALAQDSPDAGAVRHLLDGTAAKQASDLQQALDQFENQVNNAFNGNP